MIFPLLFLLGRGKDAKPCMVIYNYFPVSQVYNIFVSSSRSRISYASLPLLHKPSVVWFLKTVGKQHRLLVKRSDCLEIQFQLHHLLIKWPWVSPLTSLGLSISIFKMVKIPLSHKVTVKIRWIIHEPLRTMPGTCKHGKHYVHVKLK